MFILVALRSSIGGVSVPWTNTGFPAGTAVTAGNNLFSIPGGAGDVVVTPALFMVGETCSANRVNTDLGNGRRILSAAQQQGPISLRFSSPVQAVGAQIAVIPKAIAIGAGAGGGAAPMPAAAMTPFTAILKIWGSAGTVIEFRIPSSSGLLSSGNQAIFMGVQAQVGNAERITDIDFKVAKRGTPTFTDFAINNLNVLP